MKVLKIVVASPGDVQAERDIVTEVAEELNHSVAADRRLRLEVVRWETDAHPGFHLEGPQSLIDSVLRIQDCDILIGIFWKRFGTPVKDARSGTEHEFRIAYGAWKDKGSPQIMMYFKQKSYTPKSSKEADQWKQVLEFKEDFPKEGLWWPYNVRRDFEKLVRNHLTIFLREGGASPSSSITDGFREEALETTSVYIRPLPDSGTPEIHLSGFHEIQIPSRVKAQRQIRDFLRYCERDAVRSAARMLLGAWGEGKTEAFHRDVKPRAEKHGHHAFRIPSRSIVNAYRHYDRLDTIEARLFLAAVFHALADTGVSEIPRYESRGVLGWLERCLEALECDRRKLFLFIDEVEQLLHEPSQLLRLMLGIKQILDGDFDSIQPGGRFPGSVFIFFACTPEAYNKIASDPEFRQVFGGYGRRMAKIDVESISLVESVQFIHGLIKYAYDKRLPKPFPITSPGILRALATVAKRNMGHMVSLTAQLFSAANLDNRKLVVIGDEQLKSFSIGRTINIEGQDTKCFEDSLYERLLQKMEESEAGGEYYKQLLTAMLFDHGGVRIEDVKEIFGEEMWRGMEQLWVIFLKDTLHDLSYSPGLLSLHDSSIEPRQLFDLFEDFVDEDQPDRFRFGERYLSQQDVLDRLVDWEFDNQGELVQKLLLPSNTETVVSLFGVQPNDAEQLLHLFKAYYTSKELIYRLPQDLINEVFPPPSPPGLEFIRNASGRFNLWRRATVQYAEKLNSELPRALLLLASDDKKQWHFEAKPTNELSHHVLVASLSYTKEPSLRKINLRAWVLARSRIEKKNISHYDEMLANSDSPPHIVIFLTNEPVEHDALNLLGDRLKKRACFLTIHPTFAKQMLASYWHLEDGGAIYSELLAQAKSNLLERDIGFYERLKKWLSDGREGGFVIDNPRLSGGNPRELVGALRLLLNSQGQSRSIEEVYNWNRQTLRKLVPYGSKTGLVPDMLESFDSFGARVGDLQANRFVWVDQDNQIQLELSPPEKVILEELFASSQKKIHKRDWSRHMVILAEPVSIVEDVYVEALIQRGLVQKGKGGPVKNQRSPTSNTAVCKQATQDAETFKHRAETQAKEYPGFVQVAHMAVAKERDFQVITLDSVIKLIDERLQELNALKDTEDSSMGPAIAQFLLRFVNEIGKPLLESSRTAVRRIKSTQEKVVATYNEYIHQKVPAATSTLKSLLNISLTESSLYELRDLNTAKEEIETLIEEAVATTDGELEAHFQSLDQDERKEHFWFNLVGESGRHHNLYARKAEQIEDQFSKNLQLVDRLLSNISERTNHFVERRNKLYDQLVSHRCNDSAMVSKKVFDSLKEQVRPGSVQTQPSDLQIDSLKYLTEVLDLRLPVLARSIDDLQDSYDAWGRLHEEENKFLGELTNASEALQFIRSKFDLPGHESDLVGIADILSDIQHKRDNLSLDKLDPSAIRELKHTMSSLAEDLKEMDEVIDSDLWKPFANRREALMLKMEKEMKACEALNCLPEDLQRRLNSLSTEYRRENTLEIFLNGAGTCAGQMNLLEQIDAKLRETLGQFLNEHEQRVLDYVIQVAPKKEVDLESLTENLLSHVPSEEILNTAVSLWKKGILSVKLSL